MGRELGVEVQQERLEARVAVGEARVLREELVPLGAGDVFLAVGGGASATALCVKEEEVVKRGGREKGRRKET